MPASSSGPCLSEPRTGRGAPRRRPASGAADVPGAAVRAAAARVVHAVLVDGQSLTEALNQADTQRPASAANARDPALMRELATGVLRLRPRLEALATVLLKHPLKPADRVIHALLLVGLYQLLATRIPGHAAVAATVAAATDLGRPWAAGLLNATLRRCAREQDELLARIAADPAVRWLFPGWLLTWLQQAWPEDWQAIVAASNARAPMTLRVNCRRVAPADYAARLVAAEIAAAPLPGLPQALMLDQPLPTSRLPGFAEGLVSVQDAGAQWAARLLDPRPGERVLDACAAPGGKAGALCEQAGGGLDLTAVDSDPARVATLGATLERLGHAAQVLTADAASANPDWPGAPYQRILLDVPCSATGVIRRHPDIKWLRRATDLPALVATQAALLDALWPLLAHGGRLLYATCSLLPEENEEQVRAFLERHPDARALPVPPGFVETAGARERGPGWQLLPTEGGGDGFFYALLGKSAP